MKNLLILTALFFLSTELSANNSRITIFSEFKEEFIVYIDGQLATDVYESHQVVFNVRPGRRAVQIVFANRTIMTINATVLMGHRADQIFYLRKGGNYNWRLIAISQHPYNIQNDFNYRGVPYVNSKNQAGVYNYDNRNNQVNGNQSPNVQQNGGFQNQPPRNIPGNFPPSNQPTIRKPQAIGDQGFRLELEQIKNASFDVDRLNLAKELMARHYITSAQARDISNLFGFDDNRLEFCKEAYLYVVDAENFSLVFSTFKFQSNVNLLKTHIGFQ